MLLLTNKHRFSWVVAGQTSGDEWYDVVLQDYGQVASIPTLGALTPDWNLLVPKIRAINLAACPDDVRKQTVEAAFTIAENFLTNRRVYYFEHGAADSRSPTGCGVDQAHLHVVALPVSFWRFALAASVSWHEVPVERPWNAIDPGADYYLISDFTKAYAACVGVKTSQYFRKAAARALGMPACWDYRRSPYLNNARRTIQSYGPSATGSRGRGSIVAAA